MDLKIYLLEIIVTYHKVKIYTKSDNYDGSTITNPTFKEKYTKPIKGKVYLDEHCIIGPGTVILPGVTLEKGVSVGAIIN